MFILKLIYYFIILHHFSLFILSLPMVYVYALQKKKLEDTFGEFPAALCRRSLAFEVTKNTSTARKTSPTQLSNEGKLNLPKRSANRRQLETLVAASEVNGGSVEDRTPALDGMFSTLMKYGTIADLCKYLKSSKKMKKASAAVISGHVKEYEKCDQNVIRSLSLLYAGGVIGKVKYQQSRSALVMKNTGKLTKKGSISKARIKFGMGIPIPKPLSYGALVTKITEIDVGEVYSVRDTLCHDLPPHQKVDGVYRNLENCLLMLAKFYFETDQFRKPGDKLVWFGEEEGAFKGSLWW